MTKSELMARLAELFIENNEGTELQAKDHDPLACKRSAY